MNKPEQKKRAAGKCQTVLKQLQQKGARRSETLHNASGNTVVAPFFICHEYKQKTSKTMGLIAWIIFGLIAGAIAKAIHPGKDPGGWIVTIIIGIIGGVIGGWIGMAVGWGDVDSFSIRSFLLAIAGAVLLLWGWAKLRGNKRIDA
jgi:uncharacterized membrane protein YeaQ/YmgE (transglycosylase-associated protein family)